MFIMSEQTMIQRMYCIIPEVSQEYGSEININAKNAIKDFEWKEAMDSEIRSKKNGNWMFVQRPKEARIYHANGNLQ